MNEAMFLIDTEFDPANRVDHMAYQEGMEDIHS